MRSEPPRGISAVEVQVSLMETSQNTVFFLPPILKPTRNYSHTYDQMLQSAAVREMGEGPTTSHRLVFLRRRTYGARLCSRWHRHSDSARSRAGVVPRMPEQEPATCLFQKVGGHQASSLLFMGYSSSQTHSVISLPCLLNIWLLTLNSLTIRTFFEI